MSLLLGVDIGTLGTKAVLADETGCILASGQIQHSISYPHPGWAEQDPEKEWWGEFVVLVREVLTKANVTPSAIIGISITGLVPTLCVLDREGRSLRPAILHCDNRATAELKELLENYGLEITLEQVLPKLLWLKKHEPDIYKKAHVILNPHSYIVYRLTGRKTTDFDTANIFGGIFDASSMTWKEKLCVDLGINPSLLPEPLPGTAIAGGVLPEAAHLTGLAPGTPVIVGTGDSFVTLLSAGVTQPGEMMIYLGTAGTAILVRRPLVEVASTLHISNRPSAVEFCANILTCGQALNWYKNNFFPETPEQEFFKLVETQARSLPPAAQGLYFLPHLMGRRLPYPQPLARGTLFGLTPAHHRYHIFRALLEGIAYEFKCGYLKVKEEVRRIVVTGGGAYSSLWRQIISDVLDKEIYSPLHHNTALGAAYFTGYSLGLFTDFHKMREQWNPVKDHHKPQLQASVCYRKAFNVYLKLNRILQELY
ncbi:xylulokinase [Thermanaeromonas toyohensis ToBE]|uniref:Xylulokinase n=1 Tax=Thermanaeromonas toyohensis ToBE TaxID=698762 RepID=A0A1W1VG66_9FIRM|nr:FGGY family carbohydrate kinase [Thermanaeromonas toyohensis]SMB92210.1 xylulokinase [Thermanaeromonas toyohensis ToBE]